MVSVDRVQLELSADSQHVADYFDDLFIELVRSVKDLVVLSHIALY